ncbi:nicotinamide mononucleotide deamidase-related protein [Candidatus Bathyarchaeota archaeon]|nr:nicotinamide mononucleotide deamidase-related protein [Candidatus Bathyarchaeota archaeon]
MTRQLEIICIGNELLIGKILNTNSQWIAKRATSFGITVKRITVVGDEINEIATATLEALRRKPRFVITTGGLGPTFDDKTLEGIATALKRKTEINKGALKMVREKYEAYAKQGRMETIELTPPRIKMATLPKRAKPLHNPIGTAPGVLTKIKSTFLIALPGVPSEMEAIFENSIAPMLKQEAKDLIFVERSVFISNIMESTLAPLIDQTMHANANIYVKSHPKSEENTPHIELHFSTMAKNSENARTCLQKAIAQLSELIEKNNGKIKTLNHG